MEITVRLVLPALSHKIKVWVGVLAATALLLVPVIALASDTFGDVPGTLPQHDAINRVYAAGIMRACTAGTPPNFCPNDPVLRAQQASQWDRALGLNGTPAAGTYVSRARAADVAPAYRVPGTPRYTLDNTGVVGWHTSVTIAADGLALVSYYDFTNSDLKVAHCVNLACSASTLSTIDSTGNVGQYTSIVIAADTMPTISYYDGTNGDLKVAHCFQEFDAVCTSWQIATLDTGGGADVGRYTSIARGADGVGLISYYDATNFDLKVAHCNSVSSACNSATLATLDSAGTVGTYTSIAIGIDNRGLISYRDDTNTALKVAHCVDLACSSATVNTIDNTGDVGQYSSVAIGADGLGLISYFDSTNTALKVAHCVDLACSSATLATLDSTGFVGAYTAITIGADGLGLISYQDNTPNFDLKVAHCADVACSSAALVTLDYVLDVGFYTSVTIGADGLALITYYDNSSDDLKAAHCANLTCTHFGRSSR